MEQNKTENSQTQKVKTSDDSITIPVIEEEITIDKEIIESGKVKISKKISEHQQEIDVPILQENVSVERVKINKFIDSPQEIRHEGDTMIIPVVEEQIVVEKRLVLVEELHVKKQVIQNNQSEQVTLHKENVEIERTD